jgi:hypothetical protein
MDLIRSLNLEKLIFTVSPVRHIKDGFVENQSSKANISALHTVLPFFGGGGLIFLRMRS